MEKKSIVREMLVLGRKFRSRAERPSKVILELFRVDISLYETYKITRC